MKNFLLVKLAWLKKRSGILLVSIMLFPSHAASEIEFFSISENGTAMYDAPSLKADKLYLADRHLPVEVIVDVDGWAKVRDSSGSLAWIEKKVLSQQRYVIVIVPLADIYQAADSNSALLFHAEENIVMEWLSSDATGWVKVRHLDGETGYIKVTQVWGA